MNVMLSKSGPAVSGLEADKKGAERFEDCAVGKKALYLKYMMLPRLACLPFDSVKRVFKRVAMSEGGYTGKGIFASIAYVVVVYDNDRECKCAFRREEEADRMIACIHGLRPSLPTVSAAYEAEYLQQKAYKEAFCYPDMTPGQREELDRMQQAKAFLEQAGDLPDRLAKAAREKRYKGEIGRDVKQRANMTYIAAALAFCLGTLCILTRQSAVLWIICYAGVVALAIAGSRIIPNARKQAKAVNAVYNRTLGEMEMYIGRYEPGFPVLARYAHPIVLERICEVIRLDRAAEHEAAFRIMKEDLKKLNRDVVVDQEEYDQVVAIKPLFLVADYK